MAGVTLSAPELDTVLAKLAHLARPDLQELSQNIGGILESSTRARVGETKETPQGETWADWSKRYAKTRKAHHSKLQSTGALLDSIAAYSDDTGVRVGTNLIYGAAQQFGTKDIGGNIPARPFLGVSDADRKAIEDAVDAFLGGGHG